MNTVRRVRYGAVPAVLALLLAGCGSSTPAGEEAGSSPSPVGLTAVAPTSEPSAAPPIEGTGPEQPQQSENGGPAIPLASLPIGGDSVQPTERVPACAHASWLGDDIPPGVSILVVGVRIEPAAFAESDSGCDGSAPLCRDASFAFTVAQRDCDVPVIPTGDPDQSAEMFLDGKALCSAGSSAFCQRLAEDAKKGSGDRSIALVVPSAPTEGTSSETPSSSGQQSPTDVSPPSPTS